MALSNNQYDLSELAKVDSDGFQAALFPQIKDAYVKKMQEIYGADIDVSSASADGQYIMAESLVLNNIYRTLESISDNLSPASASGKYLDILASLSGAFRQQATYSTADIYIKNVGADISPTNLLFADKNGNRWLWINPLDLNGATQIEFKSGEVTAITVTCTETGAIAALGGQTDLSDDIWAKDPTLRGGDIYTTTTATSLQVYQQNDAITGHDEEDDASLRSRRLRSLGQSGRTVIDTLVANLLNINGVIDAWAYSNNTSSNSPVLSDNVVVPAHTVYVCVATQHGVTVPDYTIADTIYGVMTPGIPTTTNTTDDEGMTPSLLGGNAKSVDIPIGRDLVNTVKWKLCDEIHSLWNVQLTLKNGTTTISDAQKLAIQKTICNYLNNINLGDDYDAPLLKQLIDGADFRTANYGLPTYESRIVSIATSHLPNAKFYYTPDNNTITGFVWNPVDEGTLDFKFGS